LQTDEDLRRFVIEISQGETGPSTAGLPWTDGFRLESEGSQRTSKPTRTEEKTGYTLRRDAAQHELVTEIATALSPAVTDPNATLPEPDEPYARRRTVTEEAPAHDEHEGTVPEGQLGAATIYAAAHLAAPTDAAQTSTRRSGPSVSESLQSDSVKRLQRLETQILQDGVEASATQVRPPAFLVGGGSSRKERISGPQPPPPPDTASGVSEVSMPGQSSLSGVSSVTGEVRKLTRGRRGRMLAAAIGLAAIGGFILASALKEQAEEDLAPEPSPDGGTVIIEG
jgi:hypothetical protein